MKSSNLFAVFSIITLLLISEGVSIVHAQTLTKDFGQTDLIDSNGDKYCSFDVTATIETEPNGNWIVNHTYKVDWLITMTYLNESIYNRDDFAIVFSNPVNPIYDTVQQSTVISGTPVTSQNSGTLSMTSTPERGINFELNSAFDLKAYYDENIVTSGSWLQSYENAPIQIDIVNNQPESTNTSPIEPIYAYAMVIVAVIIAIGIGAYAYAKKKKHSSTTL
jgi:hypothetical protein